MKRLNSLILFLFILILLSLPCHILQLKIPFNRTIVIDNNKGLLDSYLNNNLIVSVSIGSPPQELPLLLRNKKFGFWVMNDDAKGKAQSQIGFNSKNSQSYNEINYSQEINTKTVKEGGISSETIIIGNQQVTNFTFFQVREFINFPVGSGVIGLDIDGNVDNHMRRCNLIDQLKKKDLITSYAFSIKYANDNKGELYIGELPHLTDLALKDKTLVWEKTMKFETLLGWGYTFDKVYSGSEVFSDEKHTAYFVIEYGMILAPSSYFDKVNQFFNPLIIANKCEEIQTESGFSYRCDASIQLTNFDDLNFSKGEYTFTLTKDDLFTKVNDRYLFLVYFQREYGKNPAYNWIFGYPFFRKYQMVFDQDKKIIGFYVDTQIKVNKSSLGLWWIAIIFGLLVTVALAYVIYLKSMKSAKLKKFDIIDFDYALTK